MQLRVDVTRLPAVRRPRPCVRRDVISSYYSSRFFAALRRARAFIQKPYDRVMALVGGKHFFISRNVLTFDSYGKTCFLASLILLPYHAKFRPNVFGNI